MTPQPKKAAKKITVAMLSDELFQSVQQSQGFFYVSDDGGGDMTEEQFFERVRGRLAWGQKAVRDMNKFLRKYGQTDAAPTEAPDMDNPSKELVNVALAAVAKYRDVRFPVGEDRAALCAAAIILTDAHAQVAAAAVRPWREAVELVILDWDCGLVPQGLDADTVLKLRALLSSKPAEPKCDHGPDFKFTRKDGTVGCDLCPAPEPGRGPSSVWTGIRMASGWLKDNGHPGLADTVEQVFAKEKP